MRPYRIRSAPEGQQITTSDSGMSAKCSVATATPSTWVAGVNQIDITGDTTLLSPVTLTPQDLYAWPLILEWDVYGYIDVDATATAGRLNQGLWADILTKEFPTYIPLTGGIGSASWPTTTVANRTALTAPNLLNHTMASALVTVTANKKVAFHSNMRVAFVSAQIENEATGAMQWRQITTSTIMWNNNVGDSNAGAGTFLADAADTTTTAASSNCVAMSAVDCSNGIKIAYALSTLGFAATSRVVVVGGVVRTIPEASSIYTL
jgi:hypothetical protein